jgi:hypothetical protein
MVMARPVGVRSDGEILREIAGIMGREEVVFASGSTLQEVPGQPRRRRSSVASGKAEIDVLDVSQYEKPLEVALSAEFPFLLLPVPSLFGDSVLNRQSPEIDGLRNGLTVVMGNDDFAAQGFGEKETVAVSTPFGAARAIVRSSARIKRGTALLLHSPGSPDGLALLRPGYAAVPAAIGKGE